MRGADLLVQTLVKAGVSRIFTLSGNQIMPVYDALIDTGISIVHTRHEASAVFMADCWAQLTGEIGVALVTAAPGFGNALGPLYTATGSESPVLLLSGDAPVAQDGRGAFQELDQVAVSAPLTKLASRLTSVENVAVETANAIRVARSDRPGPVHLALPFDVLKATVNAPDVEFDFSAQSDPSLPGQAELTAITDAFAAAAAPVILTGPALNGTRATDQLEDLEKALNVPVIAMESPRGLNDPSLGAIAQVLAKSDLILCLGKRVDFTLSFGSDEKFGPQRKWIVVDAEQSACEMASRNLADKLIRAVQAEPGAVAKALSTAPGTPPDRSSWIDAAKNLIRVRSYTAPPTSADKEITSLTLCAAVQRQIESTPQSVLICDGGEFGQWAQAALEADERVINGTAGAIGGVLCYALAARCARPDAVIFALMGDGTVGFQFAEFETAVREKLPFVVVIGNDRCWNAEHQIQLRDYGPERLIGCQLSDARYDLAVVGLGGHGEYVTDPNELDDALTRALLSGLPACVNVRIKGLPAPTVSTK